MGEIIQIYIKRTEIGWDRSITKKIIFIICVVISILSATVDVCSSAKLYVAWQGADSNNIAHLEETSKLYGIEIEYPNKSKLLSMSKEDVAIISSETLSTWNSLEKSILFTKIKKGQIKLMVVVDKKESLNLFNKLLHSSVIQNASDKLDSLMTFSKDNKDILEVLAGTQIPVQISNKQIFLNNLNKDARPLIWITDPSGNYYYIMITQKIDKGRLFLSVIPNNVEMKDDYYLKLPSLLPFIVFIKNSFGEKVWHRKVNQANFTIDDPWLVEPYGNLSYQSLLTEMQKANFHTTIAFIPWNYDRNKLNIVNLFLKHPNRYSIVVHGNNHDRQEFPQYEDIQFSEQEKDIHQAIARMEVFKKMTGIEYDKIFIFPHMVSPAKTFSVLKDLNFLASINSSIVPLDVKLPENINYILPASLKYYGLPMLLRHPPSVPQSTILLDMFFDKPLLFYTHQDYFFGGIAKFNELAQFVNHNSFRKINWVSLGELAESLYLERLREGGVYDVKMMARRIIIQNSTSMKLKYYITDIATGLGNIDKLIIGDSTCLGNYMNCLRKPINLAPGERMKVEITYKNKLDVHAIPIEKNNWRVTMIRYLSDFRDLFLSRNKIGRQLLNLIY